MYSPSEFAQGRYLWHFTSVLRLPSEASSPMEGMQAVCAEFVAVAGSQLGWGGSKLLEATSYSYKYSIGGEQHILLMAFWSEDWGYAYCRAFSSDRILALEIERIIKKFLPRITAEELLEYHTLATLSDNQIMMLGDMAEWGDAYSPSVASTLRTDFGI
jgi:hypothetical protein